MAMENIVTYCIHFFSFVRKGLMSEYVWIYNGSIDGVVLHTSIVSLGALRPLLYSRSRPLPVSHRQKKPTKPEIFKTPSNIPGFILQAEHRDYRGVRHASLNDYITHYPVLVLSLGKEGNPSNRVLSQ